MKYLFTFLSLFVGITSFAIPAKADCLQLTAETVFQQYTEIVDNLVILLNENDICAEVSYLPSKRATTMLKNGEVDGEIGRISFYNDQVGETAIMVPTPLYSSSGLLISRHQNLNSIAEYKGLLGIVRGWTWMEQVAKEFDQDRIIKVDTLDNLYLLYQKGRVDAILGLVDMLDEYKMQHEPSVLATTILTYHLWLAKKNSQLLPKIDKIIESYLAAGGLFIRNNSS